MPCRSNKQYHQMRQEETVQIEKLCQYLNIDNPNKRTIQSEEQAFLRELDLTIGENQREAMQRLFRCYLYDNTPDEILLLQTQLTNKQYCNKTTNFLQVIHIGNECKQSEQVQELCNYFQNSSLLREYMENLQNIFGEQYANVDWKNSDLSQVRYFTSAKKDMLAIVLYNGSILINKKFQLNCPSNNIWKFILYTHCKIQSIFKKSIIIQSQNSQQPYFESEIFPFILDDHVLTENQQSYLLNKENWTKSRATFKLDYPHSWYIKQFTCKKGFIQICRLNNMLMNQAMEQIQHVLKTLQQLQNIKQEPKLTLKFTSCEYMQAVLDQLNIAINSAIKDEIRLHQIRLLEIFEQMTIEQQVLDLLIVQNEFLFFLMHSYMTNFDILDRFARSIRYSYVFLEQEDIRLINLIMRSQIMRDIIVRIDSMNGQIVTQQQLALEQNYFLEYLNNVPMLIFTEKSFFGITLLTGQIALELSLVDLVNRPQRIVTIIHELLCHHKRLKFASPESVLISTFLDTFNSEAGELFEIQAFGMKLTSISKDQGAYILNANNWSKPINTFKKEFQQIPAHDSPDKAQNNISPGWRVANQIFTQRCLHQFPLITKFNEKEQE